MFGNSQIMNIRKYLHVLETGSVCADMYAYLPVLVVSARYCLVCLLVYLQV